MSRMVEKTVTISILFLLIFSAGADTQTVVQQRTRTAVLRDFAREQRVVRAADLQRALAAAALRGWTVEREFPDGRFMELQGLDDSGRPVYYVTHNSDAARTIGTFRVHPGERAGLNLTGAGMIVGEWDGNAVLASHREFGGRVTQMDNETALSSHSTHVAGTLIGTGLDAEAKGMAYEATLHAYDWTSDESEMAEAAANGLLISNHSYGNIRGWDKDGGDWYWYGEPLISETEDHYFGFYGSSTQEWDEIAYNAPYYLIVKSAGNERGEGPSSGTGHYVWSGGQWVWSTTPRNPDGGAFGYDCIGLKAGAKNIMTVGAVSDIYDGYSSPNDVLMSSFSSWGPVDDGRIKPDVVGNGVSLYSTDTLDAQYTRKSGTSMSSPNVAGSMVLLQEHYQALFGVPMRAATLKGLVIHTADEAGLHDGPDYAFGWGLMNTETAALLISDAGSAAEIEELTLNGGAVYTLSVRASGTKPLSATICWTDVPGTPGPEALDDRTPKLVNDLDLRIADINGTYYPWKLDPDDPAAPAFTGDNIVDNVEQIEITSPVPGEEYIITVSHKGTLDGGMQDFSLIVSGTAVIADSIVIADGFAAPGETDTVFVRLTNAHPVDTVSFAVDFNPGMLIPGTAIAGSRTAGWTVSSDTVSGQVTVRLSGAGNDSLAAGSGDIAGIIFTVRAGVGGKGPLYLRDVDVRTIADEPAPVAISHGEFVVDAPDVSPVFLTDSLAVAVEDAVYLDTLRYYDPDFGESFTFSLLEGPGLAERQRGDSDRDAGK